MERRTRVYIAGKMSGLPNYNREAFNAAEDRLRANGFDVFNPARVEIEDGDWKDYMRKDIEQLVNCDLVAALPGWQKSQGACVEHDLCRTLGIPWQELQVVLMAKVHREQTGSMDVSTVSSEPMKNNTVTSVVL